MFILILHSKYRSRIYVTGTNRTFSTLETSFSTFLIIPRKVTLNFFSSSIILFSIYTLYFIFSCTVQERLFDLCPQAQAHLQLRLNKTLLSFLYFTTNGYYLQWYHNAINLVVCNCTCLLQYIIMYCIWQLSIRSSCIILVNNNMFTSSVVTINLRQEITRLWSNHDKLG